MQAEQIFGVSCRSGCDLGPWAYVAHATSRMHESKEEASLLMGGWKQLDREEVRLSLDVGTADEVSSMVSTNDE